jgi:endonuclease G, mitochondrial
MIFKNNPFFITLYAFFGLISCKQSNETAGFIEKQNENVNQTDFNFLPTSTTNQIVKHEFYTLSYNEKYEQAEWVAYYLKPNQISKNHQERPYFIDDPEVSSHSADYKNYKKSGYDKGHLCPAADMKFSKNAFDDTFYTSNISPQVHYFNDGIWNVLEGKVRYWATKFDGIYIVTGGVLTDGLPTIGYENVAVPKYFYKVLLQKYYGNYKMIAFLIPNEQSDEPLYKFVIPTDDLEKMTGIDFYPALPNTIENQLEKSSDYKNWSF